MMENYLDNVDIDIDTRCTISQYLNLIQDRASGENLAAFADHIKAIFLMQVVLN